MSTPPVRVQITADDMTGPGFASAASKVQAFQASMNASAYSMREARGAAMLFGEEVGIRMNRHLVTAMASSELLGSALAAAFPVVAVIGFIEIAERIPDVINKAWESLSGLKAEDALIEAHAKIEDSLHKIAEATAKAQAAYDRLGKSSQQVALMDARDAAAMQKDAQGRLALLQSQLAAQEALAKQTEELRTLGPRGAVQSRQVPTEAAEAAAEMIPALQDQIKQLENGMTLVGLGAATAGKKFDESMVKAFETANKKAEQLKKQFDEILAGADQLERKLGMQKRPTAGDLMPLTAGKGFYNGDEWSKGAVPALYSGTTQAMDLYRVQTDQNAAIKAAQEIYTQTRTKAQEYSDTIANLTELLNQNRISQQTFAAAATQAASKLNENNKYIQQFGKEIGDVITQSLVFGRSWTDALKAIGADLAKLILQMVVFKSISDSLGTGGGIGGFFGQLFKGMAGHAAGGYIPPGAWGIVGERGPEPAFGGATGLSILPNSALGGGGNVYHIDARGADVSVEQRIMRILPLIEERAVHRSVAAVEQRQLRR